MTWRGSTTIPHRILACLPYLLPLAEGIVFGIDLITQFPIFGLLLAPVLPFVAFYRQLTGGIPFGGLIIFFILYMAVVRNYRIPHFIRFNTMQALMLDILLVVCGLVISLLGAPLQGTMIMATLYNTLFLGMLAAFFYAVVQTLMGRYAEIPTLSDAVYMQVRD